MIVRKMEVLRYKCLHSISQTLRPFHILVGPNASGKSTFLDVLVFVRDVLKGNLQEALRKRVRSLRELTWRMDEGGFEIALELEIPELIRERLKDSSYTVARYELRIATEDGALALPVENLWLVRGEGQEEGPQTHGSPAGFRKVMSRAAERRLYIRSETTGWNFQLAIGLERSGLIMIPEEEERFPVSMWVRRVLREGIHFLQLNSLAMRWPCPPDAPRDFQPDGSNLPLVVETLEAKHPKMLERWIEHLRTVLPEIRKVGVKEREEDRYRYLVVETQDGKVLPSWLLSDGTLRLFALTLIAYLPGEKGIYIIEEPENGIHPKALEAVYQSLSSVYDGQIFCATHSPVLLNLAKPEELLCFTRTKEGATDIVAGDQHPNLKEWQQQIPLGDLLASGILG